MAIRMGVRSDLQRLGWIAQPVDLIEHDGLAFQRAEKSFRVLRGATPLWPFAVDVLDVAKRLSQRCLADSANDADYSSTVRGGQTRYQGPRTLIATRKRTRLLRPLGPGSNIGAQCRHASACAKRRQALAIVGSVLV
jgi:hypothetical protein